MHPNHEITFLLVEAQSPFLQLRLFFRQFYKLCLHCFLFLLELLHFLSKICLLALEPQVLFLLLALLDADRDVVVLKQLMSTWPLLRVLAQHSCNEAHELV